MVAAVIKVIIEIAVTFISTVTNIITVAFIIIIIYSYDCGCCKNYMCGTWNHYSTNFMYLSVPFAWKLFYRFTGFASLFMVNVYRFVTGFTSFAVVYLQSVRDVL